MEFSANNAAISEELVRLAPDVEPDHGTPEAGRDVFSHNTIHVGGIPLKEQVMKWSLCSTKYKTIHNEAYSSRNIDTGTRFFESSAYKDWVDGKEKNKRNLECLGKPGAGKTSTVSAIIENLLNSLRRSSEPWIVLYAYFRHDSQSCQAIPIVFLNFIGQIVEKQSTPPQHIQELYQECAPHNTIPRLDQVIPILKCEISERKRSYIIVDALDEFCLDDPNSSSELVTRLEDLGARLLITSRYSVNFTPDTFSRITVYANNDDLVIYVRGEIVKNNRLKKLLKGSPESEQEIIERICEKCDGMFIIARLLIESISRMLKISQVRDVLKELPKGLDATYELAMGRIDSQSEEFRKLGRRVIEWVVFAKEKLTVEELIHAVSYEPGMETMSEDDLVQEDDIILACAGLIVISGGYVQFVHFSTQEFFARFAGRYFTDTQRTITETCLRYLALSAFTISPEVEDNLIKEEQSYKRQALLQEYFSTFPLATHAATHWGSHAFDIQEAFDHSLAAKFYQFAASPYIADDHCVKVPPACKMAPLHYQILYCARFGLALSLLGLQVLPRAGGVGSGVKRTDADLNAPTDSQGKRPLHLAAWYGHKAVLNLLIEANADVNVRDGSRTSPLSSAAEKLGHDSDTVGLLLDRKRDTEAPRMLLGGRPDPNIADNEGMTALAHAALHGHSEAVGMLLDSGADPNIADGGGRMPLVHAALNGHSEAVRMLLDGGADPNIANNYGRTPLACAADYGHSEAVRILLNGGADPNIADNYDSRTPLACAAEDGYSDTVSVLLDGGADPNITNNHGWTPLAYAARNGHSEAMRILLDGGADPNIAHSNGCTPLACAAEDGHSAAMTVLLEGGADPNTANNDGCTPLIHAILNGHSEAVRMLLAGGADPNMANNHGWTPLAWAAEYGHSEISRILMDSGADPNIADCDGKTPLAIAEEEGYTDIERMIRGHDKGRSSKQ